jgi:hypothetical protein
MGDNNCGVMEALGPSGLGGQVGWAMVTGFAGYAFTIGRRFVPRAQARALLSGLGWQSGAGRGSGLRGQVR